MKPLSLTLKGFRGIRDGLGLEELTLDLERLAGDAQLVAIAGPNGRGKTTLLDNLTPYPVMPSRAGADGLGSFSYYDHVFLPENLKDLIWEHDGKRYRSQLVLRMNGKRKTEAFLHVCRGDAWVPLRLEDGTVSDGKVDTYVRCVEGVLGSAETFFTSVFSAQGKRQLSAYRNAQIKTLLADLLGLEQIREIGRDAAETTKLLRTGLAAIRQQLASLHAEQDQVERGRAALGDTQGKANAKENEKAAAQAALDASNATLAKVIAARDHAAQTEAHRAQLTAERKSVVDTGQATLKALQDEDKREAERLAQLDRRIAQRAAGLQAKRQGLNQQREALGRTLQARALIERAKRRLPLAEAIVRARESSVARIRRDMERLDKLLGNKKIHQERVAALEREAGQAALRARDLSRRFGLTAEVPCVATDLQGRCKLLGDAREAQTLMPSAQAQIGRLAEEKAKVSTRLAEIEEEAATLNDARASLGRAESKLRRARARAAQFAVTTARYGELDQAESAVAALQGQLEALVLESDTETDDEKAERATIKEARKAVTTRKDAQAERDRASLQRIDRALAALAPAFDRSRVTDAELAVRKSRQAMAAAEAAYTQAIRDHQAALEAAKRAEAIQERTSGIDTRARAVEKTLSVWTLFAKCMSNDGVIALSIDDAGPTLSGLANDLLLACYGPRFTVSIMTLIETGTGEAREGFDIVVHDAESDESKSVTLMSGGERVWINECLTRAIALYLAQDSGRRYETLLSDEADGPLDPERKRMFMAMKREVLRLGGYRREFFVSQSPELTMMADAVIDLDAFREHQMSAKRTAPA